MIKCYPNNVLRLFRELLSNFRVLSSNLLSNVRVVFNKYENMQSPVYLFCVNKLWETLVSNKNKNREIGYMHYFEYGDKEIEHLKENDLVLGRAIDEIGMIKRPIEPDIFSSLILV